MAHFHHGIPIRSLHIGIARSEALRVWYHLGATAAVRAPSFAHLWMIAFLVGLACSDPAPVIADGLQTSTSVALNPARPVFIAAGQSEDASENVEEPMDWRRDPPDPPDAPDRPFGSAFFGGDPGPPIFGTKPPEAGKETTPWPDLRTPGPDMGDYPNSAFTLPKGRAYIEVSPVTLSNKDHQNPPSYTTPFLLRYGLTDDVEFRIFATSLTHVGGNNATTGFSPLAFDTKIHLWDDRKEWLIPAMSLEVYLQTVWGSPQFNPGWQPGLALNFDLPLTKELNLEWTVGYAGVKDAVDVVTGERFIPRHDFLDPVRHRANLNVNQPTVQWALEYEVDEKLEVFFHGFHNGAILFRQGAGEMVGAGAMYQLTPWILVFGSLNTGLTPNLPTLNGQFGFVFAL